MGILVEACGVCKSYKHGNLNLSLIHISDGGDEQAHAARARDSAARTRSGRRGLQVPDAFTGELRGKDRCHAEQRVVEAYHAVGLGMRERDFPHRDAEAERVLDGGGVAQRHGVMRGEFFDERFALQIAGRDRFEDGAIDVVGGVAARAGPGGSEDDAGRARAAGGGRGGRHV